MLLKDVDKKTYDKIREQVISSLQFTMDNWRCLDKDMVNEIVDDHMGKLEEEDGFLYCDGKMVKDIHMFVAYIKREILSRG